MSATLLQVGIGIIIGAVIAAVIYFLSRFLRLRALSGSLDRELLFVAVPKDVESKQENKQATQDFKSEINKFEQLLGGLAGIKKPIVFEVAVPHLGEEIHFYVSVPKKYAETTAKQIQGIWNGASVSAIKDDYNIFNASGATSAAYISQKESYALPIKSYMELETDTFNSILGGFAKINEVGEGAALQILIKPAGSQAKKGVRHVLDALKRGESLEDSIKNNPMHMLKETFNPKAKEEKQADRIIDEEAVKALTAKLSKPMFTVNARILASAATPFQANDVLEGIAAGFDQFASPSRNDFKIVKAKNSKKLAYRFIFREFDNGQTMTLTSEEIASFFHFPTSGTETPKVKWLKSKEAPPPPNLPSEGTLIGESVFRGERKQVRIMPQDRRRHVYVIGQTGTGKSKELSNMIVEDIRAGKGVCLVDPHGDLVEDVLGLIPKERAEDVIVFDPGDMSRPMGLNMLDYNQDKPEERTFIVNEMQSIFNKLFDPTTMGPMFEQYMRNALLLMMEDIVNEPATLVEVPRIFTDAEFRQRKLDRIHNAVVVDFWEKEATKAGGEASLANMVPYITSKFGGFISNDYVRPIIGQTKSAFNFREIMDQKKILLVNLSKGRIGDISAGLLGMVVVGKILMAALSRVDTPEAERNDFALYVDEFQNFTTDSIATILSEARKYGLSLVMAHQFIAQLTDKIRDAVFGNVGSQIVFRVGAKDAEFLVKQFEPIFSENDLVNIDNRNAYAKLLINGLTAKPFNIQTMPFMKGSTELATNLKEYSRLKYGTDRAAIEDDIYRRLRE
jgi:hypothetical protein